MLQTGIVDMWVTSAVVTLERSRDFLYTTPFAIEKYAALMKRPTVFYINFDSLTANIDIKRYVIMFAMLFLLFLICIVNERMRHATDRNDTWHIIMSLFPCNGVLWPQQIGATRRMLFTTIGFGILILSSIYQAKLSEQLMVPYPPPVVTLTDIERYVLSGNQKLLFNYKDSPTMQYVSQRSPVLNSAMETHTPVYYNDHDDMQRAIDKSAILIDAESVVLKALSSVDSNECNKYVYLTFDEWKRTYSAMILRAQLVSLLESLNVIVAERLSIADKFVQSSQLSEECRKHVFEVHTPNAHFEVLELHRFSGVFVFLGIFLVLDTGVLLGEIGWKMLNTTNEEAIVNVEVEIEINIPISDIRDGLREKVFAKYEELLDLVEDMDLR